MGAPLASHFELRARTRGFRLASGGLESDEHRHREAQLVFIVRGRSTCEAAGAWWIVPPDSALWVPSNVTHRIRGRAPLEGYNVFLDPRVARAMPRRSAPSA